MITWYEERVISVNIEKIWRLFDLENIQRIMPNVIEHKVLEKKEGVVGSTYQQKYKEGKRVETYIVEDVEYENTDHKKHNKSKFTLAKMFDVEVSFTLIKIDENQTRFIYQGQNKGANFFGKILLKLASLKSNDKVVKEFMDLVEAESLKKI